MAKYLAKLSVYYEVEIEVNASDESEADDTIAQAIDDHLVSIAGNYSGTKIEVTKHNKKLLAFYNKSNKEAQQAKKDNLNAYYAGLDKEERALLRDIIVGE